MVVNVTGYLISMAIGYFLCLIFERSGFSENLAKEIFADPEEPEEDTGQTER